MLGQFADDPPWPPWPWPGTAVPPYEGVLPLAGAWVDGGTSVNPDEPVAPDEPDEVDGVVVADAA
jgi:hypothetical protein